MTAASFGPFMGVTLAQLLATLAQLWATLGLVGAFSKVGISSQMIAGSFGLVFRAGCAYMAWCGLSGRLGISSQMTAWLFGLVFRAGLFGFVVAFRKVPK